MKHPVDQTGCFFVRKGHDKNKSKHKGDGYAKETNP